MELFTLILINFGTAVALYIIFSVRFSMAVDKIVDRTRKNIILKDLRENIEATIEYINTSLDLMDQKNRSFYQLIRRSEELIGKLDSHQGSRSAGELAVPESLTEQEMTALSAPLDGEPDEPGALPNEIPRPRPPRRPVADTESGPRPAPERARPPSPPPAQRRQQSSESTLDRVLDALGEDRVEISGTGGDSAREIFANGEQSAGFARRFKRTDRPGKKREGFYPVGSTGFTMDEVGLPRADTAGSGFLSMLEGAGRTVRRMLGIEPMAAAGTNRTRDGHKDEDEDIFDLVDESGPDPGQGDERDRLFEQLLREKRERLAAPAPAPAPREDRFEFSGDLVPEDEFESSGYATELQRERRSTVPDAAGQAELQGQIRASSPAGRREIILQLLDRGYSTDKIAAYTGIGRAEVDLVASLPVSPAKRRRMRRQD